VPDTSQQPPDFPVFSLLQLQLQDRASPLMTHKADLAKPKEALSKVHAFPELLQRFRSGLPSHLTSITPHHFKPRMGQSLGQISVVGQQQQTLSIFVKSPNCEQPLIPSRNEVHCSRTPLRVTVGAEHPLRLIQQKVAKSRHSPALGIQPYVLNLGIHQPRRIRDHLAIYCHSPVTDVLFAVSPRIHSGNGKKLLQTHASSPRLDLTALDSR
jgi:hypothetical protein